MARLLSSSETCSDRVAESLSVLRHESAAWLPCSAVPAFAGQRLLGAAFPHAPLDTGKHAPEGGRMVRPFLRPDNRTSYNPLLLPLSEFFRARNVVPVVLDLKSQST